MLQHNKLYCMVCKTKHANWDRMEESNGDAEVDALSDWKMVARCSDIAENDAVTVQLGKHQIAIFNVEGHYFATDAFCTHARAPLVDGYLDGEVIECPLHQGRFNLRSGKALCSPATRDLRTFPLRIDGGDIRICVS